MGQGWVPPLFLAGSVGGAGVRLHHGRGAWDNDTVTNISLRNVVDKGLGLC